MSATTQNNNMTMINDMFSAFMERAVNDGPLSEYQDSINEIKEILSNYWLDEENQTIFSKVLGSIKTKTTRKSKKSDDDTPKPRRPKSAYIFFCKDKREEVKTKMTEDNDGDKPKPTEVMRGLGAAWRELKESGNNELLSKYEDLAAIDKFECHAENGTTPPPSYEEFTWSKAPVIIPDPVHVVPTPRMPVCNPCTSRPKSIAPCRFVMQGMRCPHAKCRFDHDVTPETAKPKPASVMICGRPTPKPAPSGDAALAVLLNEEINHKPIPGSPKPAALPPALPPPPVSMNIWGHQNLAALPPPPPPASTPPPPSPPPPSADDDEVVLRVPMALALQAMQMAMASGKTKVRVEIIP